MGLERGYRLYGEVDLCFDLQRPLVMYDTVPNKNTMKSYVPVVLEVWDFTISIDFQRVSKAIVFQMAPKTFTSPYLLYN